MASDSLRLLHKNKNQGADNMFLYVRDLCVFCFQVIDKSLYVAEFHQVDESGAEA